MNTNDFAKLRAVKDLQAQNDSLKWQLSTLKSKFQNAINEIEEKEQRKYTEQYALFGVDASGRYQFQRIVDVVNDDEEYEDSEMGETVLILQLPDSETIPEFEGF